MTPLITKPVVRKHRNVIERSLVLHTNKIYYIHFGFVSIGK